MNIVRAKPLLHLSTFTMEKSEGYEKKNMEENFDEDIQEYIYQIFHSVNRSQAIHLRTNALEFIDQWRLKHLEQLDQHVRSAGQLILNAFDGYQSIFILFEFEIKIILGKQKLVKCSHRVKQSSNISHNQSPDPISESSSPTTNNQHHHLQKTDQKIEISIDRLKSSSTNKRISFSVIDFGRDFTFETLAHLSSSSPDIAMSICENNTLIYSQQSNELVIVSLINPKQITIKQLNKNTIIRDLCYVDWLFKCLVIADEEIYLFDYRTTEWNIIDSGIGYICGAIDSHHHIFYLVKQSTLYKYDQNCLLTFQADQYPIADGYHSRRLVLDNKTNDYLALLVRANDEKNYILVYSTKSLANGYFYKIMIDDRIEREWICSNGNEGWLIRGTYPGSCFDLNINGLASVRVFDCNEIRNIISINEHQRYIIRTKTEIFVLIKNSFIHSF